MPKPVDPLIPAPDASDMSAILGLSPADDGSGWGWNDSGTDKTFGLAKGSSTGKPGFAFDTKANLLAGNVAPVYAKDSATASNMASYSSYSETTGRLTISGTEYVMVLDFDGDFYRIELQAV